MVALQKEGFDVKWVHQAFQGIDDMTVIEKANEEQRIIITFDKDFGDLVFKSQQKIHFGVILLRLKLTNLEETALFITQVLQSREDWHLYFSVIEYDKIRIREL